MMQASAGRNHISAARRARAFSSGAGGTVAATEAYRGSQLTGDELDFRPRALCTPDVIGCFGFLQVFPQRGDPSGFSRVMKFWRQIVGLSCPQSRIARIEAQFISGPPLTSLRTAAPYDVRFARSMPRVAPDWTHGLAGQMRVS